MRCAFDKIIWVSVGQEPDVRELQASILLQTNKTNLSTDMLSTDSMGSTEVADKDVLAVLKEATNGFNILLVLDDVWEAKYVHVPVPGALPRAGRTWVGTT